MRPCFALPFLALALAACSSETDTTTEGPKPLPLPANTHSHGDPSDQEQELLELTQRARANPADTGKAIVTLAEVQNALKQYGVDVAQVEADFATYAPAPPLAFDPKLAESARFHSLDMAEQGFQAHDGSAGESFSDRITKAGYAWSFVEENIFAYAKSIPYCNAAFLIDWGNPDLGHRAALLDLDGWARDVGISVVGAPSGPNDVGPLVVTQDFGAPQKDEHRYLVGVVYLDANENGVYDPGEGQGGMKVVPAKGDTYAVTSKSGGFAIPFLPADGLGTFAVQLQDGSGVRAEANVTVGGDNVKVDFALRPPTMNE